MNMHFFKWLISISVFLCLLLGASSVLAKKPKPPPEPPIDGAACAESVSFFPAFVHALDNELFLSNAAGDCAIPVYKTDWSIGGAPSNLSYRWYGDEYSGTGIITWSEQRYDRKGRTTGWLNSKIMLLHFTVDKRVIDQALPITPSLLLEAPDTLPVGNVFDPDLSPSGGRVLITGFENYEEYFFDEILINCTPPEPCRNRIFEGWLNEYGDYFNIKGARYSLDEQRIYFELVNYPNRRLVFIEKNGNGEWSSAPTLILDHDDGGLGYGSVGYWDHDDDGYAEEVFAHPRDYLGYRSIEILDVEACVAGSPDCVVSRGGEEIVIEGYGPSFSSFSDGPPDLLFLYELTDFREYDLTTGNIVTLKTVHGAGAIDAAD